MDKIFLGTLLVITSAYAREYRLSGWRWGGKAAPCGTGLMLTGCLRSVLVIKNQRRTKRRNNKTKAGLRESWNEENASLKVRWKKLSKESYRKSTNLRLLKICLMPLIFRWLILRIFLEIYHRTCETSAPQTNIAARAVHTQIGETQHYPDT